MTTRALIYGGIQIFGIVTRASSVYDGISIEHRGTTRLTDGKYEDAYITVGMNPHDALDLALCLIRAVERHGQESQRSADTLIKRLARRQAKRATAPKGKP